MNNWVNRIPLILGIVVLFCTLCLLAWSFLFVPSGNTGSQSENSNKVLVDTSGWLKYRNEEFAFELKYPNGFYIEEFEPSTSGVELFRMTIAENQ